jgi:N-dimethylarginine dimethylaminohydrolase
MAAPQQKGGAVIAWNEYGALRRVVVRHARSAFAGHEDEWRDLQFTAPPDTARAAAQFDAFVALLSSTGAVVENLPQAPGLTLDAIYTRDAALVTPRGAVLCRMGKAARLHEPAAHGQAFAAMGLTVAGAIEPPGQIEGGDVVWFDERTVAVGRGYRTSDEGIRQFAALLPPDTTMVVVPLPHHRGPGDVFHLMSIISPVDRDLAVVYSPLMPVPFREWLIARGIVLVEVPQEEFDSMGSNVLALAPRQVLMVEGNPVTRERLTHAGARVQTYDGSEISLNGGGGPTCLTRPIERARG